MWNLLPLLMKYRKVFIVVAVGIALMTATALFMRAVYKAGKDAGVAQIQATYLTRDLAAMQAVTDRLEQIAEEDRQNLARWTEEAQSIADAVDEKISNKETVLREIPVEKIVTIEPDCSINYSAIELLDDIGSASPADSN